jgi:nucleotide-binding universal stress UspA family protein
MMKRVLLATDGSPTAAKATATAVELARDLEAELVVVAVWDVPYAGYGAMGFAPVPTGAKLAWLREDEATRVAAEAAGRAEEAGVETRTRVLRGFPVDAICDVAERVLPDVLVIGSHGRGVVKRAFLGSVSAGVLHRARWPVLIVRGRAAGRDVLEGARATAVSA